MSWSMTVPRGSTAQAAKDAITMDAYVPQGMKDYALQGLAALVERYGDDVTVDVTAHGHVCNGPQSYEVTSAVVEVKRHEG